MGKIWDRFGIYDIIAVLLTGIGICIMSLIIWEHYLGKEFTFELSFYDTFPFLVISYLVGIFFQETSNLIQRVVFRENALLKKALDPLEKSNLHMVESEIEGVRDYIKTELHIKKSENLNDNVLFNYCKFYVIRNKDTTQVDRNQSLSSMSRSLSLYFALLTFGAYGYIWVNPDVWNVVALVGAAFLSWLLYKRYIRFAVLRYILIIRLFYYDIVVKSSKRECE